MCPYRFHRLDDRDQPYEAAVPTAQITAIWCDPDLTNWRRDDVGETWQVVSAPFERICADIDEQLRRTK